jgi:hypothetical protein
MQNEHPLEKRSGDGYERHGPLQCHEERYERHRRSTRGVFGYSHFLYFTKQCWQRKMGWGVDMDCA